MKWIDYKVLNILKFILIISSSYLSVTLFLVVVILYCLFLKFYRIFVLLIRLVCFGSLGIF